MMVVILVQEQARCGGWLDGWMGWMRWVRWVGGKTLHCKKGSVVEWSFVVLSPPSLVLPSKKR